MSEPREPEYVWAFPPEQRRGGRGWLIGVVAAAAVVIVVVVVLLITRPWASADPAPTASASPTAPTTTPTASATPTATATPAPAPTPTASVPTDPPPATSPPVPADPELSVFRAKIQPLLDDAGTGLSYARDSSGQEGVQIVDQLQGDAGRMSDAVAPRSIAQEWGKRVSAYGAALDALRSAFETGAATAAPLSSAQSALERLNSLVAG